MEERFKAYLEEKFSQIAPTTAAVNLRKKLLLKLKDRAQELKIKGMVDDDLIFDIAVEDLGDLDSELQCFEHREIKTKKVLRTVRESFVIALATVALLAIVYVVIGATASIWHPTWLIIVGGVFVGLTVIFSYIAANALKKNKTVLFRLLVALSEILGFVFLFLLLRLVFGSILDIAFLINYSWMTFLIMVIVTLGVDSVLAFNLSSKSKFVELPVFLEVFGALLYVMVGILIGGVFWAKAWPLCLIGVVAALVEVILLYSKRTSAKNDLEEKKIYESEMKEDESNYKKWD